MPQYVIDAPGGGGKVPVNPDYVLSRNADRVVIRNFEGKIFEYPEAEDGTPLVTRAEGNRRAGAGLTARAVAGFSMTATMAQMVQRLRRAGIQTNVPKMVPENCESKPVRAGKIIAALKKTYPDAHCELNYSNPLELLIATILSAQCNDKQVNIVTEALFKKYRTAADYAQTQPGGIRAGDKAHRPLPQQGEKHPGLLPQTGRAAWRATCRIRWTELIELDGVGRKTANVVLGNAFNINCGIVVDTHVARLSGRLGLTREKTPEKIEQALMKLVPQAGLDAVQPLADLARPAALFRAQPGLPELRNSRSFVRASACRNCQRPGEHPDAQFMAAAAFRPRRIRAHNMALDAALLEAAPRLGRPVLRFYSWTEPAASFGYFQKYAEVERMTQIAAIGPAADGRRPGAA